MSIKEENLGGLLSVNCYFRDCAINTNPE